MSRSSIEREKLYQVYNGNLQRVLQILKRSAWQVIDGKHTKTTDGYICPLCARIFSIRDLDQRRPNPLTLEHIEPDSIGGKKLVLTCKECNNSAGRQVDKALKIHTDHNASHVANAKFILDGLSLNGRILFNPESNQVDSIFNKNNDFVKNKIEGFFNKAGKKEIKFKIKFENKHKLICALLKVAHLKMFRSFGYGYLMNESIYKIASQINNPEDKLIDSIGFIELPSFLPEDKDIFFGEINGYKFFLVKVTLQGTSKCLRYGVFIPGPRVMDLSLYQKIKDQKSNFDVSCVEGAQDGFLDNPYSYYNFFK